MVSQTNKNDPYMKRLPLIFLLSICSAFVAKSQNCCAGFEAAFTYYPTQTENRIEFEFTSNANYDFIVWNFGDGSTSNQENPDHIYSAAGIYQVCVVIENNDGCRSELCYEVAVEHSDDCNDFLADFLWSVNPSNSLGVQFDNIGPLPADDYIWHFGDGSTSHNAEPYHQYAQAGMYQVCFVMETDAGCRSEYCREVCVEAPAPEPPTASNCCDGFEANFSYYPTLTENRIEFEYTSNSEYDDIIWHFGDGHMSTQENPDHIYGHAGIYQVCVVIESDGGCRSELCYEVAVEHADDCNDFLADFVWQENIDSLGIQFENISQGNAGAHIWHFGDGSTSNDANPYHEYEHAGVYQVCLVIENNDGCRSEYCRSVCVEDFNPCAGFETHFTWSEGWNNSHLIEFDGIYSGQIDDIIWHFGDGSTSNDENPNHEYAQPGLYEVCLVIENDGGCRSEYCHTIAVDQQNDPCENFEADFSWEVDYEHGGVHFENLSTGNPTSYTWHFGDGHTSHDEELTHHYDHTGVYQVCLHIENADGCSAEFCQMVFLPSYYFYLAPPLGVSEIAETDMTVYPNPFEDILQFGEAINGTIELVDVQGRMVLSKQVSGISSINLSGLTTGLYVMRISDENSVRTARIVKR